MTLKEYKIKANVKSYSSSQPQKPPFPGHPEPKRFLVNKENNKIDEHCRMMMTIASKTISG